MVKKKRLIAIGLIFVGLIGLAIAIAPMLGLMTVTSAAFEDYPTEFDPTSSSMECKGESEEFEVVTKEFSLTESPVLFLGDKKPKTICENFSNYNQFSNTITIESYIVGNTRIEVPDPQVFPYTSLTTEIPYTIIGLHGKPAKYVTVPTLQQNGNRCFIELFTNNAWNTFEGTVTNAEPNNFDCILNSTLNIPANTSIWSHLDLRVYNPDNPIGGNFLYRISQLILEKPLSEQLTITYTIPRSTIPTDLHYREYSCPLESGRYLTAQTFTENQQINSGSFAYQPNYFCSRHGVIKTQLATQRSVESTEELKQIIAGQTLTVPDGETWTFFYVPNTTVDLPIKCEEGDYYDTGTQKCIQLVSGFVYVCTDPTTNLIGNQCVKEADLTIICPNDQDPIDGKCYIYGTPTIVCPTGYTQIGDECHKQGTTVTDCPEGYDLRDGACYIEGKNIIECPDGYDLQNSKCYKILELITNCPEGYDLRDGACWTTGNLNMVCPDGTHKATIDGEERCIIDSTYCPDGYTRQDDKCVKAGEIICPSGTIKIGDSCQRTETICPEGSIEINNTCVREGEIVCPEGTQMNEAKQCVQDPIELPDINYLSAGIGTISLIAGVLFFRF